MPGTQMLALPSPPQEILAALRAARKPLLLSHMHPDGDGVGSELGLARTLEQLGAAPRILNTHRASEKFDFLDPDGIIEVAPPAVSPAVERAFREADLIVILDTSEPSRLGHLEAQAWGAVAPRLAIDHHLCDRPERFDLLWSVPKSPATGNLVLSVVEALGVPLSAAIGTPLFVAIATDTGWFRFGNASPVAFEGARRLVAAGADPERIYREVFESSSLGRMRLLGQVLAGCRSAADGRIVYAVIRRSMLEEAGVPQEEIDGFIDQLKGVRSGQIALLAVELSPGHYKVSLRSRGRLNVHEIATRFGGGGHAQAAGCRLEGTEAEVLDRVLEAACEQL